MAGEWRKWRIRRKSMAIGMGSSTISAGLWHHVAGVFDGSQMRVYLDGVLDGTLSTSNVPASGTGLLVSMCICGENGTVDE